MKQCNERIEYTTDEPLQDKPERTINKKLMVLQD